MCNSYAFNYKCTFMPSRIKCARLHLKRKGFSLFLTVTDMNYKVISALSLGQVSTSANRRIKCSSTTVERLLLKLRQVLSQRSISYLFLLQRSKFRWQLRNLDRILSVYGITVLCLESRRRLPHGFMRAPKKPRK